MLDASPPVEAPDRTHVESVAEDIVYSSPLTEHLYTQLFDTADRTDGEFAYVPSAVTQHVQETACFAPIEDYPTTDVHYTATGAAVLRKNPADYDSVWDNMVVVEFTDESGLTCEAFAAVENFTDTLRSQLDSNGEVILDSAWGLLKVVDAVDQRLYAHFFVLADQ